MKIYDSDLYCVVGEMNLFKLKLNDLNPEKSYRQKVFSTSSNSQKPQKIINYERVSNEHFVIMINNKIQVMLFNDDN